MNYGFIIKEIRKSTKKTQDEFAKSLNVSRSTIAQIEVNKANPTLEIVEKIFKVYSIEPNDFFKSKIKNVFVTNNNNVNFNNFDIKTIETIIEITNKDCLNREEKNALKSILDNVKQDLLSISNKIDNIDK